MDSYEGGYKQNGYPSDWRQISLAIRTRAGNRCERCGIEHGEPHPDTGRNAIIQVAHLDQVKSNCAPDNLEALCHVCHGRHDARARRYGSAGTEEQRRRSRLIKGGIQAAKNDWKAFGKNKPRAWLIVRCFGGPTALAWFLREDGVPAEEIARWHVRDFIPLKYRATLIALAKKEDINLSDEDFVFPK